MYVKKSLLTTAILGAVFAMSGCETIPVDQHEKELSSQKSQYEQQIASIAITTDSSTIRS
ncbi:hypothetical protein ACLKMH_04215 [Psychromonas sp. KJ10-10]|uniref:hypothetical protein n=1 Tax=Psychromonas sp. KJ10-10 TaxID=3391823 RepID=UPI0039B4294A